MKLLAVVADTLTGVLMVHVQDTKKITRSVRLVTYSKEAPTGLPTHWLQTVEAELAYQDQEELAKAQGRRTP